MKYSEFKQKQQEKSNDFVDKYIYIAFGGTREEVIKTLKEDYNITDYENLIGLTSGCYCYKKDVDTVNNFYIKLGEEKHSFVLNNLHDALIYEFWNHESAFSRDYNRVIKDYFDLTDDEIAENKQIILSAIKDFEEEFYTYN